MARSRILRWAIVLAVVLGFAYSLRQLHTPDARPPNQPQTDIQPVLDAVSIETSSDTPSDTPECPHYTDYASDGTHAPVSGGRFQLPFQRPSVACRTFASPEVEAAIDEMRAVVADPDLFRLFENCFPNTLDTAIAWHGLSNASDTSDATDDEAREELTFVTTGDINAMWLRDSANQLQSYRSLLRPGADTGLASLFRGTINLQARYVRDAPFCNAFRPPRESGLTADGGFGLGDDVSPAVDHAVVYECKYELDSLAAFLQLSHDYYAGTHDASVFGRGWTRAVASLLDTVDALRAGTFDDTGDQLPRPPPYTFQRGTNVGSETLTHGGAGSPVRGGTGLVRSAFRPSDDACTYQLFVPGNMMLARYLAACAVMAALTDPTLAQRMTATAAEVRTGIETHGRTRHAEFGDVYAYEVDGFGSHALLDDANLPSLLGAPLFGYVDRANTVYQNTRRFVLSRHNPYYMAGPVLSGTGGPHVGVGKVWPMGALVQIMTEDDDDVIVALLKQLLASTDGLGLMHESVSSHDAGDWTRPWFAWANGLFGQMMLDLRQRKPHLLARSYQ